MADDLQRSLDGMSLQPPQQQQQSSLDPQRQSSFSSGGSGLPSPSQTSQSVHAPPGYGSMHSVSSNHSGVGGAESASARFERFFNTGNPSSPSEGGPGASHHQYGQQANSLGPGSSAAGLASNGAFGSFGHAFGGSTGTAGGSAFGSTGSGLRSKSSGMRGGLPSQWGTAVSDSYSATSPSATPAFLGTTSQPGSGFLSQGQGQTLANGVLDDDIIPTAIVVKNIPFSIKREQLLQIIEDLQIPMPYAFNYHFDQGVFRGLAFANFRSGEEADAVVAALNGFDVSGRKLRVEYKKVLQAGEKERIEKEKAIKRMQSMQIEKERERVRRNQLDGSDYGQPLPPMPGQQQPQHQQHDPTMMQQQAYGNDPSIFAHTPMTDPSTGASSHPPLTADTLRVVDAQNGVDASAASDRSAAGASSKKEELDLNDPATLEIYSRVLLFKDDRMRDELSFSKSLSPMERRTVHLVAQKLGMYHYSMGEGEERYVIVTKNEVQGSHKTLRSQASTIGRSNRGDMGSSTQGGLLAPGSSHTTGRSGLRAKKSAPDMKRARDREGDGSLASAFVFGSGANHGSQGGYSNGLLAPGGNVGMTRKSNGNLREGYSATMGRRPQAGGIGGAAGLQSLFSSPFDVPPVPSLPASALNGNGHNYGGDSSSSPSGLNSNSGSLSAATSQHVLRQPAGPNAASRGFAQRARIPVQHSGQGAESSLPASSSSMYDSRNNDDLPPPQQQQSQQQNQTQQHQHYYDNHELLADADVRTHSPLEV